MRSLALAAFLLATFASGCLSPPAGNDLPATTPTAPLDLAWGLSDCKAAIVAFSAPAAAVQAHLPPGFRPLAIQEAAAGLPAAPGEAAFGMEMMACGSGAGLDGSVAGLAYGSYFTFVQPPAELSRGNVTFQFYKWDVLVPDAPRRDLLAGRGLPAADGSAAFSLFQQAGPAVAFEGDLRLGGVAHHFRGEAAAPYTPTGSFVEFTQVPRGFAVWSADYTWSQVAVGPATVDVGHSGLAAEILGAGVHTGSAFAGVVDFQRASIALP